MYKVFNGKVTIIIPGLNYEPTPHFFARTFARGDEYHITFFTGLGPPLEHSVVCKPCIQKEANCVAGNNKQLDSI